MLLFAPYLMFFFFFFGKRDKLSYIASAIINLSMVSIVDSLLSTLHKSANRILRCEATRNSLALAKRASLFFLLGLPPSFRASRGFAAPARVHCSH